MTSEHRRTEVRSVQVDPGHEERVFTFKATQLVWLLFGILEALIGLRIVLKLIAANPGSPFTALIYRITDFFLWPFTGVVASPQFGGMVLELSSFIAMIVYALIAWAIERLIWVLFYRPRGPVQEVSETISRDDHTHL
jgi:hypothetical protein